MPGQGELGTSAAGELTRLRWVLRAGGAAIGLTGAGVLSVAQATGIGWGFHLLNGLVFLIVILLAWLFAAVSRRIHVERERRYQARLFIRTVELQDVAMRDELTQLFNRRYFFERLQRELSQARHLQRQLAICVMDVNGLKGINDAYGHEVGDVALANLARLLVKSTRSQDIPARLGGDEFGVIMTETSKQGAFSLVERIRRDLEASPVYEQDGQLLRVTVSVGVAGFPWGGETVNELMRRADAYMYAAKGARYGETDPQAALRPGLTRQPEPLPRRP